MLEPGRQFVGERRFSRTVGANNLSSPLGGVAVVQQSLRIGRCRIKIGDAAGGYKSSRKRIVGRVVQDLRSWHQRLAWGGKIEVGGLSG